ncbi:hypothetical protein L218DRAFT_948330 [Marasmius fiardii PR-910]|nr:hypothetical protein L218DRAFT_948330 [Marasmius fiardii PR-910]
MGNPEPLPNRRQACLHFACNFSLCCCALESLGVIWWSIYRKWLYIPPVTVYLYSSRSPSGLIIQYIPHVAGEHNESSNQVFNAGFRLSAKLSSLAVSLLLEFCQPTGLIAYMACQWIKFDMKAVRGGQTRGEKKDYVLVIKLPVNVQITWQIIGTNDVQ